VVDVDFSIYRKTVFECINLINEFIGDAEE
jgi:hypothetical protein